MRSAKILLLLLLPLFSDFVCCKCEDDQQEPTSYSNCSVELYNLNNSGAASVVSEADTLHKSAFGLQIKITRPQNVCSRPARTWFMSSAYATKCDCGTFAHEPLENILDVSIKTIYPFDTAHPAGSDVTEYFYSYIDEYTHFEPGDLNSETGWQDGDEYQHQIFLMVPPPSGTVQQFEISIELSDERVLTATSEPVVLI